MPVFRFPSSHRIVSWHFVFWQVWLCCAVFIGMAPTIQKTYCTRKHGGRLERTHDRHTNFMKQKNERREKKAQEIHVCLLLFLWSLFDTFHHKEFEAHTRKHACTKAAVLKRPWNKSFSTSMCNVCVWAFRSFRFTFSFRRFRVCVRDFPLLLLLSMTYTRRQAWRFGEMSISNAFYMYVVSGLCVWKSGSNIKSLSHSDGHQWH